MNVVRASVLDRLKRGRVGSAIPVDVQPIDLALFHQGVELMPCCGPDTPLISAGAEPPRPSPCAHRLGWFTASVTVGLTGGIFMALLESFVIRSAETRAGTAGLGISFFAFSLINHVVLGMTVCTPICLIARLAALVRKRPLDPQRYGPLAAAAFLVAELLLLAYALAIVGGVRLPGGLRGLMCLAGALLLAAFPVGWVFRRIRPTIVGRAAAALSRMIARPAGVLFIIAIALQWHERSRMESADGSWPVTRPNASAAPRSGSPNIVLIVFDALRADRLGCYGYPRPTSPHIDAFARDAVVFTKAISPAAWTVPSHASMFTGLYPSQHGARFGLDRLWLNDRFVTLAEALRNRGYQTLALSNNPIVSPATNLTRGFDRVANPSDLGYSNRVFLLALYRRILARIDPLAGVLGPWFAHDAGGRATTELARRWLGHRDRSRPVFLFVNVMETHDPFEPGLAYRRAFVAPGDLKHSYTIDQNSEHPRWMYCLARKPVYTERDLSIMSDLYDGRVRESDDRFADLVRVVDAELNLDETVVVLLSDHGENLGDHGMLGHQFSVLNSIIHAPLIIRWPGVLRPRRVDRLVQTFDIFPTILEGLGIKVSQAAPMYARSLGYALLPPAQDPSRYAFCEYLHWPDAPLRDVGTEVPDFDPRPWQNAFRAVFDERFKFVARYNGGSVYRVLFDLLDDPRETRDLAVVEPKNLGRLEAQVTAWPHPFTRLDPNHSLGPKDPWIDAEQRDRLRRLGYIQ
jgi:arylsulfatase A-like enzyme